MCSEGLPLPPPAVSKTAKMTQKRREIEEPLADSGRPAMWANEQVRVLPGPQTSRTMPQRSCLRPVPALVSCFALSTSRLVWKLPLYTLFTRPADTARTKHQDKIS